MEYVHRLRSHEPLHVKVFFFNEVLCAITFDKRNSSKPKEAKTDKEKNI